MKPNEVKIGDRVRVKVPVPAQYNGYAGLPSQTLTPDLTATVESVRVPKVRIVNGPGKDGRNIFVTVGFDRADKGNGNGCHWTAGVNYDNLARVTE